MESRGRGRRIVRNPVFLTLGVILLLALIALPLLGHAPNRLVSGRSIGIGEFVPIASAILIGATLVIVAAALIQQRRPILIAVLAAGLLVPSVYLWGAGLAAERLEQASSPIART